MIRRWLSWLAARPLLWFALVPLAAIAIAFRHSLRFGLLSDAAFLIEDNLHLRGPGAFGANLVHDYFWSSSGNSLPYWRPLTKGSWVLEYGLFGGWAGGFHLVQVALHVFGAVGVLLLARACGAARGWAIAASLFYALHPALIEPVAMVMARSDVACAAGMIWALLAWIRWRDAGTPAAARGWAAVHVAALVLALGSKETAVVLAPVLTLLAAFAKVTPASGPGAAPAGWRRWLPVAPAWAATGLYLIGRRLVLGSGAGLPLELDPLRVLVGGGRYLYGLWPLRLTSALEPIPRDPGLDPLVPVTAALGLVAFVIVVVFAWRRLRRDALALAALIPLSLAPVLLVSQLNVPVAASRFALADRWALPAIAAAAVLLALIGTALASRALVRLTVAGTLLWVAVTLVRSGATHAAYRDTETLAAFQDARFEATPEPLRTLEDRCDRAERRIHQTLRDQRPTAALSVARHAPTGCPHPGRFSLLRLIALVQLGRAAEAAEVAARLEREGLEPRYHAQAAYHAGLAHAGLGDLARAERELRQADRLGYRSCNLPAQLGRVLARRDQAAPAAEQYERAAACSPGDPRPLLAAATLWLTARQPGRAAPLFARIDLASLPPALRPTYEEIRAGLGRGRHQTSGTP